MPPGIDPILEQYNSIAYQALVSDWWNARVQPPKHEETKQPDKRLLLEEED